MPSRRTEREVLSVKPEGRQTQSPDREKHVLSKVRETRRAPHPLACSDGGAGDGKETAWVAGAPEEILGFSLAMAEEFDEDLVLYVMLVVFVVKVLDVLVRNVLLCPLVNVADRDVFFGGCWRPGCTCRREAVGERFWGIGLERPVVAAFCRVGVWKRVYGRSSRIGDRPPGVVGVMVRGSQGEC